MNAPSRFAVAALVALAASFAGCDVFSDRTPCAKDAECKTGEVCSEGFCAPKPKNDVPPPDGVDSHPLRGSACPTPGLPCTDAVLTCSIFSTCEERCSDAAPCSDGDVPFCTDVGAGPSICTKDQAATREACPAEAHPETGTVDITAPFTADCVDGSVVYVATNACNVSGTGSNIALVGGDFTFQLNQTADVVPVDGAPCTSLVFYSLDGLLAVGGDFFVGRRTDVAETAPDQAPVVVRARALTTVLGDVTVSGGTSAAPFFPDVLRVVSGSVTVSDNAGETELEMPDLTDIGGDFVVTNDPELAQVNLSSVVGIGGDVVVTGCPKLPRCALDAVVAAAHGTVTIEGVDDAPTCP